MDHDALFFAALLQSRKPKGLRLVERDHVSEEWRAAYDFVRDFIRENSELPHPKTVAAACSVEFPEAAPESPVYYAKAIRENAMRLRLETGLEDEVVGHLEQAKGAKALEGAKKVIADVQREFRDNERGLILLDQRDTVDARRKDYELRRKGMDKIGIPLPWAAITRATGGFQPGEAWAILARPSIGKTWALIVIAVYLWQYGYRVLFASMETPPHGRRPKDKRHRVRGKRCIRCNATGVSPEAECPAAITPRQRLMIRLDAVGSRVSALRLLRGNLTPGEFERFDRYLDMCEEPERYGWGQIRVVSAPAVSSVEDLEMEILEYEPDLVLWDSAYLAAKGKKRNEAAGNLIIDWKHMLERTGVPGLLSWHFNREVDEKATEASINDAKLTDEMATVIDVALAVFRPPEVKDAGEAIWRSLKVREGEEMREVRTHFQVKNRIDFSEIGVGRPGEREAPPAGGKEPKSGPAQGR